MVNDVLGAFSKRGLLYPGFYGTVFLIVTLYVEKIKLINSYNQKKTQ